MLLYMYFCLIIFIGNFRVCYTMPYVVVLMVLQDMSVVLEILFYYVKLLYGSSINRRSRFYENYTFDSYLLCKLYYCYFCFDLNIVKLIPRLTVKQLTNSRLELILDPTGRVELGH